MRTTPLKPAEIFQMAGVKPATPPQKKRKKRIFHKANHGAATAKGGEGTLLNTLLLHLRCSLPCTTRTTHQGELVIKGGSMFRRFTDPFLWRLGAPWVQCRIPRFSVPGKGRQLHSRRGSLSRGRFPCWTGSMFQGWDLLFTLMKVRQEGVCGWVFFFFFIEQGTSLLPKC